MSETTRIPTRSSKIAPLKMELTHTEREQLRAFCSSPGYDILLAIMQIQCYKQDAILLAVPVEQSEKVIAEHRVDVAMWQMFEGVQSQVQREIDTLETGKTQPTGVTDEERETAHILDARATE